MPLDFLTLERKQIHFFGKTDLEKKNTKNFHVNSNSKTIRAWYLRDAVGGHTYLRKKNFPLKFDRN